MHTRTIVGMLLVAATLSCRAERRERAECAPAAAAPPPVTTLVQPGPLAGSPYQPVNEPDFTETMERTSAEKGTVMDRQQALLEARYDLSDAPHPYATMTRGK